MAKKLRITAVGCGGVGVRHQKGHLACPETELVAVCDMDVEKAEQRAKELGIERWYPSISEMLSNEECEAVDVVTADHLHFQPVMECLEAGKHVLCEKPLSLSSNSKEDSPKSNIIARGFVSLLITLLMLLNFS